MFGLDTIAGLLGYVNAEQLPAPHVKPDAGKRSSRWPRVRAEHLQREPFCRACGCRSLRLLEVHHILPFSWPGGQALELEPSNLLTLCESPGHACHLWIGHLGDYRSRNPTVVADCERMLARIRGRPYPRGAP